MSGGFFRGTSTDQDTRFSNKKSKLLKSQKFAHELETLVDMTKVKMDIMRPWIAKRVTELIGFEDEVLINFIYGLLEGKAVNGKEIQISITGFMERNTGKFMKELWLLLLSAQQNASGVPQQFLDVKEEENKKNETKKKEEQEETDRITNGIQRQKEKEKQEIEEEKANMAGHGDMSRDKHGELDYKSKHGPRASGILPTDEKERNERKGFRRRSRVSRSPDSPYHSRSPRRNHSISPRRSLSNSRSYSGERRRSRNDSGSPRSRSRSISSERPRRRPITSPPHKRRSSSPARNRIRSPHRRQRSRSPLNRRSRSPRRWSRTPPRRTPMRYRSKSPSRRRSPYNIRRRSPSPLRRRTPPRRQSPSTRRYQRSPSPPRGRSRSPVRRSSVIVRKRSQSSSSSSPIHRSSLSPAAARKGTTPKSMRSPTQSPGERRIRSRDKHSPASLPRGKAEVPVNSRSESKLVDSRPAVSMRSPQRDMLEKNKQRSPYVPEERSRAEKRSHRHSPGTISSDEDISTREIGDNNKYRSSAKVSPPPDRRKDSFDSAKKLHALDADTKSRKTHMTNSEKIPDTTNHKEHREQRKGRDSYVDDIKEIHRFQEPEILPKLLKNGSVDSSPSKETEEQRTKLKEKRKHKEEESDDYSSSDSYEERKEAKRRRKEEKRLKKEEKRQKRRHKREERHGEKRKLKSSDHSEDESDQRRRTKEDTESDEQKKSLEIELREKALEKLRAKKGISN